MRARTGRPWGHWAPCTEGFMGQRESTRRAEDKWRGIECRQKPHLHFSESILQIRLKFRISTSSYSWALPGSVFPVYSNYFKISPLYCGSEQPYELRAWTEQLAAVPAAEREKNEDTSCLEELKDTDEQHMNKKPPNMAERVQIN